MDLSPTKLTESFRAIAYINGRFSLKSRNGNEFKYNFTEIGELKQFCSRVVLDEELIIMRSGVPDFEGIFDDPGVSSLG